MDSIKKKMEKLSNETADAESRIAHFEEIKAQNEAEADKFEEQVTDQELLLRFWIEFSKNGRCATFRRRCKRWRAPLTCVQKTCSTRYVVLLFNIALPRTRVMLVKFIILLDWGYWAVISLLSLSYPAIWSISIQS